MCQFLDDPKLSGAVDSSEGQGDPQKDLYKLQKEAQVNLRRFNEARGKVLHLSQQKSAVNTGWGMNWSRAALPKCLRVLVDERLDLTHQRALTGGQWERWGRGDRLFNGVCCEMTRGPFKVRLKGALSSVI